MKKLPVIALSLVAAATLAACGGSAYEASATPAPQAAVIVPATTVVQPSTVVAAPVVTYPAGTVAYAPAPTVAYVQTVAVLRPGYGRVDNIQPLAEMNGTFTGNRRITLRMDDGSVQVLDTRGPDIALGGRVEITAERNIRYPIASR